MKRCAWDGSKIRRAKTRDPIPASEYADPFLHLPPEVAYTPEIAVIAERYLAHDIDWAYYPAFQAAAFLRPKSAVQHAERRRKFARLAEQAQAMGFQLPKSLIALMQNDKYVDRLYHNCIWVRLPDELCRLPVDTDRLMFLAFSEGQGCGNWHLLLAPDGTHCVVCAEVPFGVTPLGRASNLPDYSKCLVQQCAESFDEWLYHYFRESAEHERQYTQRLNDYFRNTAGESRAP